MAPAAQPSEAESAELRRLRWRCRRGMRELDQLMLRYLDRRWSAAGSAERADFERLLDTEDDRLWRWFMGREEVDDPALGALVEHIGSLPA
jgi:antitoxin CptB